jgi:importin-9
VMLNTWAENAATFQGFWPTRISALALCTLLRAGRPSLQTIVVKGDIIITAAFKNSGYSSLHGALNELSDLIW